ncbi:hypothetical protein ACEPAF_9570 [Sanghuangporus sanghuang]
MANPNSTGLDYTRFTVPQLKARCKELSITGYSKLGKAALLQKLAQNGGLGTEAREAASLVSTKTCDQDKASSPTGSHAVTASISRITAITPYISSTIPATPSPANSSDMNLHKQMSSTRPSTVSSTTGLVTSEQARPKQSKEKTAATKRTTVDSTKAAQSAAQKKRKLSEKGHVSKGSENVPPNGLAAKKSTCDPLAQSLSEPENTSCSTHLEGRSILKAKVFDCVLSPQEAERKHSASKSASKRFRPLAPRPKSRSGQAEVELRPLRKVSLEHLAHLDFSAAPLLRPPGSLNAISIPPSLSERKRVNAWSVILSGLSDSERRKCALVSRTIRYAVYLSAIPIIARNFGPWRFSQLSLKYNMSMTNFWPYLKHLRCEVSGRRAVYAASFLSKFFGDLVPVADNLWGCPDNDKQLTVALRFLMTRLWFAISLNMSDTERARNTIVTDAQEVVKDEIWRVTVFVDSPRSAKDQRYSMFYVLESTCEVIGLPAAAGDPLSTTMNALDSTVSISSGRPFLRTDWSDYIQHRISCAGDETAQFPLLYYLKTTNAEEYKNGISTLWLKRTSKEEEVGQYKRKVAERYILACVVGNSVSGKWMSSSHMAQVFAGTASEWDVVPTSLLQRESQRVNLFLPAHHLIESVHFTTSGPEIQNLHPALAIVQTPSREYFILRDNGMEVGCEEDGVWPVWRDLLDCDARGVACP